MMRCAVLAALVALALASPARAQLGSRVPDAATLVHATAAPLALRAGAHGEATLTLRIEPSWHVNANPPALDYLIATTVKLTSAAALTPGKPIYPAAKRQKFGFEESELLVYDGEAQVRLPIAAAANAANGRHTLSGTVRFQSCNDQVCLPPATVPFSLVVTVSGGAAPGAHAGTSAAHATAAESAAATAPETTALATPAAPETSATPRLGFATQPPPGGGAATSLALDNPIARALARGSFAAFVTLFLLGLALNLTPCVYPMLGVTVSIFGARSAAPPLKVFGIALVYVLGITVMYSTLGTVAAITGGLFGAFMANPLVLVGIGVLLAALSLSMFGLYEFQIPPALMARLGGAGTTGVVGTFLSGLLVGVFAAPCIGPPIAALLAIVGAKGDPWFGFKSFFVLSLGLGAPYLVLGTFSNLIQTLPRSGEWMVWVKKVFGTVMLSVGLFYALLGLAPRWSAWVMPASLLIGGLYLGFFEKSAAQRRGFRLLKWTTGLAGLAGFVWLIATPRAHSIAFREFSPEAVAAERASGQPVLIEFSAAWCVPCKELERSTFSDARVLDATRRFHAFKVDLTHFDSPESERWRKQYAIAGVPTVLFLAVDGQEVRAARIEGFVPPEKFLERVLTASAR